MRTKKNNDQTRVIFRKFRDGEIIALFPDLKEWGGNITSYLHIGQHGTASPLIVADTKPATPAEYAPLLAELESIGYRLAVRQRMSY